MTDHLARGERSLCSHSDPDATAALQKPIAILVGQLSQGGTERQLYFFLNHCDRSRWDPVVYVSGELGFWEQPLRELGIRTILLRGNQVMKLLQFRAAVLAQGAKTFFSWSSYTNGFGIALTGVDITKIGSFRNAFFADLPTRARWLWTWMSLAGVSTIVCNSQETRRALVARCGSTKRIHLVPNAVEMFPQRRIDDWKKHWREKLGLNTADVLVVGVGRLEKQKNFWRFIDVVARVSKSFPVRAAVAGSGSISVQELQAYADQLGIGDRVRFIGMLPDARELISAADIFLLSSDHEGMPNVVLEAMSMGVPCVTTDVNGVRDLIDSQSTGRIAACDADALSEHVLTFAMNAELRRATGARARQWVAERFGADKIASEMWAICG